MKLERYALLAEIVGGVAIVVTLIVLITEVRAGTDAIQSSNRQSVAARWEAISLERAANEKLAHVMSKVRGEEALTPAEEIMFQGYLGAVRTNLEEAFLLYRDGELEREFFEARASGELGPLFFGHSMGQRTYAIWKSVGLMTDEFAVWLDQELVSRYGDLYSADPLDINGNNVD